MARECRSFCHHPPPGMGRRALSTVLGRIAHRGAEGAGPEQPEPAPEDRQIIEQVTPYTMTSAARIQSVIDAVRYCQARGIEGAFAECGVWRGGSVLAMILTLQEQGAEPRDIHLYDTFEGMTQPTDADGSALEDWLASRDGDGRAWPEMFGAEVFHEEGVRDTLLASGYPTERL